MNTANTIPDEPVNPNHNITVQELDRDLLNLNLPVIDLIATEEECKAMYPPGVYRQMTKRILEYELTDASYWLMLHTGRELPSILYNPTY